MLERAIDEGPPWRNRLFVPCFVYLVVTPIHMRQLSKPYLYPMEIIAIELAMILIIGLLSLWLSLYYSKKGLRSRRMRMKRYWLSIVLVVLIVVSLGIFYWIIIKSFAKLRLAKLEGDETSCFGGNSS